MGSWLKRLSSSRALVGRCPARFARQASTIRSSSSGIINSGLHSRMDTETGVDAVQASRADFDFESECHRSTFHTLGLRARTNPNEGRAEPQCTARATCIQASPTYSLLESTIQPARICSCRSRAPLPIRRNTRRRFRFQVPMNYPQAMRRIERAAHSHKNIDSLLPLAPALRATVRRG